MIGREETSKRPVELEIACKSQGKKEFISSFIFPLAPFISDRFLPSCQTILVAAN